MLHGAKYATGDTMCDMLHDTKCVMFYIPQIYDMLHVTKNVMCNMPQKQ